jgi:hypothetical protein
MSVACAKCRQIGAFDLVIAWDDGEGFDLTKKVGEYSNEYRHSSCINWSDFKEVPNLTRRKKIKEHTIVVRLDHMASSIWDICSGPIKKQEQVWVKKGS